MAEPNEIAPLLGSLIAVQILLERFEGRGLIIGGVAASLLGRPRLTADVDVVLLASTSDLPRILDVSADLGLTPRLTDAEDFARRRRVLLLRHEASGIEVDLSLGMLPFEVEAVERGVEHRIGSLVLRLPTPEDLIILKAVAHRPVDLMDIEAIVANNPDLDGARVRYWVQQFAEALDAPDLWTDIAHWF